MLDPNPETRYTALECLNHSWFSNRKSLKGYYENAKIGHEIVKNIKDFTTGSILKKRAINLLVKFMTSREISNLNTLFETIDTDNSGFIEAEELAEALKKLIRIFHNRKLMRSSLRLTFRETIKSIIASLLQPL